MSWSSKLLKFSLCRGEPLASATEIDKWESILLGRELSKENWQELKNLVRRLLKISCFPLSILLQIRSKIVEVSVGFVVMKGAKIFQLLKDDTRQLLMDINQLLRTFIPILPENVDERVPVANDEQWVILFDFSKCLYVHEFGCKWILLYVM